MPELILRLISFDVSLSSAEATILGFLRLLTAVVSSSLIGTVLCLLLDCGFVSGNHLLTQWCDDHNYYDLKIKEANAMFAEDEPAKLLD